MGGRPDHLDSFHSIGIPSEWGPVLGKVASNSASRFHSIGIPSEWGHEYIATPEGVVMSFHSIGIPSEWGLRPIQSTDQRLYKFPFNWDPQRVGTYPATKNLSILRY